MFYNIIGNGEDGIIMTRNLTEYNSEVIVREKTGRSELGVHLRGEGELRKWTNNIEKGFVELGISQGNWLA